MKTISNLNKTALLLVFSIITISFPGCEKVLNVPLPANVVLVSEAYNDDGTATASVLSIYSQMVQHSNFEWGGITLNTSLYADDILPTGSLTNLFYTNTLTREGKEAQNMMAAAYTTILYANTSIERLLASSTLTPVVKKQLLGECYFARAFTYFYVVNLWGNAAAMPLSPAITDTQSSPSVQTDKIYAQIAADLRLAQENLTNAYPVTDKCRPNLQAANALLARVNLYTGRYAEAIAQANAVVNSGLYSPLPSTSVNFLTKSKETIWALQGQLNGSQGFSNPDATRLMPFAAGYTPSFVINDNLVNSFEAADQRRANWTVPTVYYTYINSVLKSYNATYVQKYKQNQSITAVTQATENYVMLRAAEIYLILAEAYYKTGDIPSAVINLNIVRARAGLLGLPQSLSGEQCRAAIEQENRVEFFAELGHRFLDMKRWPGIAGGKSRSDEVFPITKAATALDYKWASYKNVFPIADPDMQANKNLVQNPGY